MPEDIQERLSQYTGRRGVQVMHPLGDGKDGNVFSTSLATAVKGFRRREAYERELACYRRLAEHAVIEVRGYHVPKLVAWDDELLVIEMTVVQPPFLLDFAETTLDVAPDFSDEVIEQWHADKLEEFGASRWEEVQRVIAFMRGHYGIHLLDVNPGNIIFADADD